MKTIGNVLIGSQNYMLHTETSDKDYKIIVTPTFDDLYNKKDLNGATSDEHYSLCDIRALANNLTKGNPNAIEMLFSTETQYVNEEAEELVENWREFYRNGYVESQWDYFTNAVYGIIYNSLKRYGVTLKTATRAMYFTNLVRRLAYTTNFKFNYMSWRGWDVWNTSRKLRLAGEPINVSMDDLLFDYNQLCNQINEDKIIERGPATTFFNDTCKQFVWKELHR